MWGGVELIRHRVAPLRTVFSPVSQKRVRSLISSYEDSAYIYLRLPICSDRGGRSGEYLLVRREKYAIKAKNACEKYIIIVQIATTGTTGVHMGKIMRK